MRDGSGGVTLELRYENDNDLKFYRDASTEFTRITTANLPLHTWIYCAVVIEKTERSKSTLHIYHRTDTTFTSSS